MIFKSDREREGYLEGLRQARAGERKDHRTKGLLQAALQPFDHSFKSYMDGLNGGYAEGLRETNVTHLVTVDPAPTAPLSPPSTPPSTSMRHIYEEQAETLRTLQGFLRQFSESLNEHMTQYERYVADLAEHQLDARTVETYESEFLASNRQRIRTLIDKIGDEDIPWLQRQLDHIEDRPL